MQGLQDGYLAEYRSLKLTRDSEGVLVAEFHSNDGPCTFTAQDHTEFVDAFYRIAQDRANKIVILTGAGGELDRKSTRLNSSHMSISYAVFCLKKKKDNLSPHTVVVTVPCRLRWRAGGSV